MREQLARLLVHPSDALRPVVFIVAWLVPLVVIILYRAVRIPARLREIKASLLRPERMADDREKRPSVHYVRLFLAANPKLADTKQQEKPAEALTDDELEERVESQFLLFHGNRLYVIAWLAVAFTSAMALAAIAQGPAGLLRKWAVASGPDELALATRAIYALLGAYVWSVYEIISRQSSCDLTPEELFTVAVRYLVAIPLGFAVALLFELADPKIANAVAFCLSAFPLNEVRRMIRRRTLKKLGEEAPAENPTRESLLSESVDGLSLDTLARLSELQITTYTDLAYADPLRIMLKTGYSLRHVLQWTDHALLAVYAPKYKRALRDAGLPCALDVKEFYEAHFADVNTAPPARWAGLDFKACDTVTDLAKRVDLPAALLCEIFQRVSSDPHVRFLDTLWYTGYLQKDIPRLPKCYRHKALAAADAPAVPPATPATAPATPA